MKYDTLFIDWDGTLSQSRLWGHWKDDPKRADDYQSIQECVFQSSDPDDTFQRWMLGKLTTEQALAVAAAKTGIDYAQLLEHMRHSCQNMSFIDERLPHLLRAVQERGVRIVIATDNMDCFTRWTVPALRVNTFSDDILSSHLVGAFKRETATDGSSLFFGDYLRRHTMQPGQVALLDDGAKNEAVAAFGIDFIHVSLEQPATTLLDKLLL
ncbi:MAG TPA: hypothetical protein VK694_04870 [Verrucomicrobiae bacterium]|nr:hypothetical protein [Verrucomicrobiae bacterium]